MRSLATCLVTVLLAGAASNVLAQASPQTPLPPPRPAAASPASQAPDPNENAQGISNNPSANTPGQTTFNPISSAPSSSAPSNGLFGQAGKNLLDHGFDFHGVLVDHYLNNSGAGSAPGNDENLDVLRLFLDVDLQKAIGLPGGFFHVADTYFWGRSNSSQLVLQTGGAIDGYETTPMAHNSLLTTWTYEEQFLNGRASIEAGRTNPHRAFFIPNSIDPFSYDSTTIYLDGDVNSYPYSQWGGRVTYHLTPKWYLQEGEFEDNYIGSVDYPYDFSTKHAAGLISIAEIAYRSEYSNSRYPANLEVGFFYNDRSGPNNVNGTAAAYSKALERVDYGEAGIVFAQGSQTIWRGESSGPMTPPPNISIYGSTAVTTTHPQPIDMDALIGVNFTGLLPLRPRDVFEVQMRYQKLSDVEAANETFERHILNRRAGVQQGDGLAFEAINRVNLNRWLSISPLVQYYKNPDNYFVPIALHTKPHDGIMFGVYAGMALGPLLGTSNKPF